MQFHQFILLLSLFLSPSFSIADPVQCSDLSYYTVYSLDSSPNSIEIYYKTNTSNNVNLTTTVSPSVTVLDNYARELNGVISLLTGITPSLMYSIRVGITGSIQPFSCKYKNYQATTGELFDKINALLPFPVCRIFYSVGLGGVFGNISASVYRPIYGNENFTSAMVVWNAVQNDSNNYDVEVRQLGQSEFIQVSSCENFNNFKLWMTAV